MGRRRDRRRVARPHAPRGEDQRGHTRHAEDVDSEVLAGFLQALRTADLDTPRLWLRLCWAAWRAGVAVIKDTDTEELPLDLASGPRTPRMPYGHPDLLLGRAAPPA